MHDRQKENQRQFTLIKSLNPYSRVRNIFTKLGIKISKLKDVIATYIP